MRVAWELSAEPRQLIGRHWDACQELCGIQQSAACAQEAANLVSLCTRGGESGAAPQGEVGIGSANRGCKLVAAGCLSRNKEMQHAAMYADSHVAPLPLTSDTGIHFTPTLMTRLLLTKESKQENSP